MKSGLFLNCINSYIMISLVLLGAAGYAYRVNSKLSSDDPLKKDLHPAAVFLTPLWPIFAAAGVIIYILRAMLFIFTLFLFTIGLVVIRKPFFLKWLIKITTKTGNTLLKANMLLFRVLFPQQKSPLIE